MELKAIAVGAVATLLVLSAIGAGAFVATGGLNSSNQADSGHDHDSHDHGTSDASSGSTTTAQPVSEDEVPEDVKDSVAGAKALKANLSESDTFENASVSITRDGEVVVTYTSSADNGPALKDEMTEIAFRYSAVVGSHPDTGGLTVAANGVKLMVSSDTAIAYSDGKLKDNAYEQTFHWSTYEHHDDESE